MLIGFMLMVLAFLLHFKEKFPAWLLLMWVILGYLSGFTEIMLVVSDGDLTSLIRGF